MAQQAGAQHHHGVGREGEGQGALGVNGVLEEGLEAGGVEGKSAYARFASGFLRPSSNSTHRLTPPEISTEPAGCGQLPACLSGQDIGRRLHMLLQGGGVEQHIAQVAAGRHCPASAEGREARTGWVCRFDGLAAGSNVSTIEHPARRHGKPSTAAAAAAAPPSTATSTHLRQGSCHTSIHSSLSRPSSCSSCSAVSSARPAEAALPPCGAASGRDTQGQEACDSQCYT